MPLRDRRALKTLPAPRPGASLQVTLGQCISRGRGTLAPVVPQTVFMPIKTCNPLGSNGAGRGSQGIVASRAAEGRILLAKDPSMAAGESTVSPPEHTQRNRCRILPAKVGILFTGTVEGIVGFPFKGKHSLSSNKIRLVRAWDEGEKPLQKSSADVNLSKSSF